MHFLFNPIIKINKHDPETLLTDFWMPPVVIMKCTTQIWTKRNPCSEPFSLGQFKRLKLTAQTQHSLTFQLLWSLSLMRCAVSSEWISLIRAGECLISNVWPVEEMKASVEWLNYSDTDKSVHTDGWRHWGF